MWIPRCGHEREREHEQEIQRHTKRATHNSDDLKPVLTKHKASNQGEQMPKRYSPSKRAEARASFVGRSP